MNVTVTTAFPPYASAIVAILAAAVSIATQVGNLVVLIAFLVESSLRIPSNYFIASLAVTDVLIGLISMNLFITYQLLGYWPLGQLLCDVWLSLDFSACLTSQYTVFLITLDRYCSVKIPVSYRNWRTLGKVRFMICISWLFPAGLFTPVIFGWKQLTSEPPRPEGKCDVSFTYYPIFNTTLILGYFWTTLVVMCGLYVGIYRVAQRLQRKTQSAGRRLAELFAMGDQDLDDFEDGPDEEEGKNEPDQLKLTSASKVKPDNNEHLKLPTLNAKGSVMGNDSGFKDFPTGIDDPISGYESAEMVAQHWLNGPQTDDLGWSDGETQVVFSPLKTCEERFDLRQVQSPEEVNTDRVANHLAHNHSDSQWEDGIQENEADLQPPSLTDTVKFSVSTGATYCPGRRLPSQPGSDERDETSGCPEPFYCECDQRTVKQPGYQLRISDAESPGNSSPLSIVSVHLFVPSPKVPIPGSQITVQQAQTSTQQATDSQNLNDSPVWVENCPKRQSPTKQIYYCPECYQILDSKPTALDHGRYYRSSYEGSAIPTSPSKTVNMSELSSSGLNESSDRTNDQALDCSCPYHIQLAQFEAILFTSDSSEMESYSDTSIPWYKSGICSCTTTDLVSPDKHNSNCCFGFVTPDRHCTRKRVSCICLPRKFTCCNGIGSSFSRLSKTCFACNKTDCLLKRNIFGTKTNRKVIRVAASRKISSAVSSKRSFSLAKPTMRNSLGQLGNSRSLESHNRRHARKALRTISFILGAFIICWTPYHIIMMIKGFCDKLETQTSCVSTHLYNLSYWLCYMNSPINPFCYALSNASFRRTFFRILRGDFQRK